MIQISLIFRFCTNFFFHLDCRYWWEKHSKGNARRVGHGSSWSQGLFSIYYFSLVENWWYPVLVFGWFWSSLGILKFSSVDKSKNKAILSLEHRWSIVDVGYFTIITFWGMCIGDLKDIWYIYFPEPPALPVVRSTFFWLFVHFILSFLKWKKVCS